MTFDEHGGTYDHVPPPAVPAPDPAAPAGQLGFRFDRSGLRVPAIAISAWIPDRTVVTAEYRNTSVLATLRTRWELGAPLTGRDAVAAELSGVLSLQTPRDPATWPDVTALPVPPYAGIVAGPERAMHGLCSAAFRAMAAFASDRGKASAGLARDTDVTRAEALELLDDLAGDAFIRLRGR